MSQKIALQQQESEQLIYSQAEFLVSLIASPEIGGAKRMSENCGVSIGESLARFGQDGVWSKMYGGFYQLTLDGTFEAFSGTFPDWGIVSGGVCTELMRSEHFTGEIGYSLWPTPTASMWKGAAAKRYWGSPHYKASYTQEALRNGPDDARYINPNFVELLMGSPDKWTDLEAWAMP